MIDQSFIFLKSGIRASLVNVKVHKPDYIALCCYAKTHASFVDCSLIGGSGSSFIGGNDCTGAIGIMEEAEACMENCLVSKMDRTCAINLYSKATFTAFKSKFIDLGCAIASSGKSHCEISHCRFEESEKPLQHLPAAIYTADDSSVFCEGSFFRGDIFAVEVEGCRSKAELKSCVLAKMPYVASAGTNAHEIGSNFKK